MAVQNIVDWCFLAWFAQKYELLQPLSFVLFFPVMLLP